MAEKDYYAVLGVSKAASDDEVRKAYRAKARQYHPDVNKAPDAAAKFNEVQQAYDVLSDAKKRKMYDQFGPGAFDGSNPYAGGAGGPRGGRAPQASGIPDIDSEELSDIFDSIFGGTSPFGPAPGRGGPGRRGRDAAGTTEAELTIAFETAVHGGVETVRLSGPGKPRTGEVRIPPGIEDGAALRVRGDRGAGDVLLRIRIRPHAVWRRGEHAETGRGLDLYADLDLNFAEAALGAVVPVPTPGGTVDVTIPAGCASGRKLRLRGKGIVDSEGRQGDFYAVVRIVSPPGPYSAAEEAALRSMAARTPKRPG